MIPNIPIATDNIYKFACLFGLAIIVASIFSFVNVYSSTLDKKVQLSETIIRIEAEENSLEHALSAGVSFQLHATVIVLRKGETK